MIVTGVVIRKFLLGSATVAVLLSFVMSGAQAASSQAGGAIGAGSTNLHWDEGAEDCSKASHAPLSTQAYNQRTWILRENLCATWEAPFMYLLLGSKRALLIDTGDVADPGKMPLATTVMDLLPGGATAKLSLLVVHTHRHLDHRSGDGQFASLPSVQVVGYDLESVKRFYNFPAWPNGLAQIDLGDRIVDVIPSPGHNETEVSFYDRETGLLFSGDFLLQGRLLVDDTAAYRASAERVADFVKDRPVSYVLGGHIEKNASGSLFPWQSQYHPKEHPLPLTKDDVLALPVALRGFNGFYLDNGQFVILNSIRILIVMTIAAILLIVGLIILTVRYIRRRRRRLVI